MMCKLFNLFQFSRSSNLYKADQWAVASWVVWSCSSLMESWCVSKRFSDSKRWQKSEHMVHISFLRDHYNPWNILASLCLVGTVLIRAARSMLWGEWESPIQSEPQDDTGEQLLREGPGKADLLQHGDMAWLPWSCRSSLSTDRKCLIEPEEGSLEARCLPDIFSMVVLVADALVGMLG